MPDEVTPSPEVDQEAPINAALDQEAPATEAPADTDYEKRYNDMRSEFDRRGSELSNYRFQDEALRGEHGPEQQALAFQRAGVEVQQAEEEAEEDPFEDPYEKRIGTLEQRLEAKEEAEEQAQADATEAQLVKEGLTDLEKEGTVKLTEIDKEIIKNDALINRFNFRSIDDLNAALKNSYDRLVAVKKGSQEEYRTSKNNVQLPPVGSAGEEKLDTRNPEQRRAFMLKDFEARQALDQGS